jgi:hypothetical protein
MSIGVLSNAFVPAMNYYDRFEATSICSSKKFVHADALSAIVLRTIASRR